MIDYFTGLKIYKTSNSKLRKRFLLLSLFTNLGLLGVFKYYNFFIDSFNTLLSNVGVSINTWTLNIILPVGISFYTFQTLSYTIDIYKGKIKPTKDFIAFGTFVAFFPQLVAGPIERASNLLPQFLKKRDVNYTQAISGLKITAWGLFKKVVVADNLAKYVDIVFANQDAYGGVTNIIAIVFFAFQIYCDFSGYSDIAIGTARIFGFSLMTNFNTPYFATSLRSFWQKWHISLSTWFRDYVYIPMGGNRVSKPRWYFNIIALFLVSGLWHGANWTFVIWGAIHGIFYLFETVVFKHKNSKSFLSSFLGLLVTFTVTCMAWVFFRANNLNHAVTYLSNSFSLDYSNVIKPYYFLIAISASIAFLSIDFFKKNKTARQLYNKYLLLRWSYYYMLIIIIILFGSTSGQEFIYFQF